MALVRFEPFREIDTMQRQMNRLFDDFFVNSGRDNGNLAFAPAAELSETAEAYHLKLEVPGMDINDLDIQATAEAVSVSGDRKSQSKTSDNGMTRSEFRYGKFQRVIPLPGRINNSDVQAEYKDGILTLTLPKAEEEKNKVVKVKVS
ncbi:MAG: Hsp20/alpha crystallin family protein [Hormoscilla sp.]